MRVFCLFYACVPCVCSARPVKTRRVGIIPVELELDDVSHHLDAGTQTNPSLTKAARCLNH